MWTAVLTQGKVNINTGPFLHNYFVSEMRYRGLNKHANNVESDPASWVSYSKVEEEEVKVEEGRNDRHVDKETDPSYIQFVENEESKLLKKFFIK
jgi:hypothetical protein